MSNSYLLFIILVLLSPIHSFGKILSTQKAPVSSAHGMYVKNKNAVWLTDTFKQIGLESSVYNSAGKVLKTSPKGTNLAGISKHPRKDLYAYCDLMESKVILANGKGKVTSELMVQNPWNARWTPSAAKMYVVTSSGSVLHVSNSNVIQVIIRGLDAAFDIAPIKEDSLWVSEQGTVGPGRVCLYRRAATNNISTYEKVLCNKNIVLQNPEGLWPLKDGGVVVVDTEAGTLIKISPDGSSIQLEQNLGLPILVQVLEKGNWVVYTNQSSIGPALIFGKSLLP